MKTIVFLSWKFCLFVFIFSWTRDWLLVLFSKVNKSRYGIRGMGGIWDINYQTWDSSVKNQELSTLWSLFSLENKILIEKLKNVGFMIIFIFCDRFYKDLEISPHREKRHFQVSSHLEKSPQKYAIGLFIKS